MLADQEDRFQDEEDDLAFLREFDEEENADNDGNIRQEQHAGARRQWLLVGSYACIVGLGCLSLTSIGLAVGIRLRNENESKAETEAPVPTTTATPPTTTTPATTTSTTSGPAYIVASDPEARIENEYTIIFAEGVDCQAAMELVQEEVIQWNQPNAKILATYDQAVQGLSFICGPPGCNANYLQQFLEKYPDFFTSVEEDMVFHSTQVPSNGANGLDRIDQMDLPLDGIYNSGIYNGSDVNIYVLDTGLTVPKLTNEFGNRARSGFDTTGEGAGFDGNGHGTHVAGTVASASYGVAKGAQIIPVKVLDRGGGGSTSTVIDGIDLVIAQHNAASNKKTVINMSLGGSRSTSINSAVEKAVAVGIVVVVAAGNDNRNACNYSPASAVNAITVASSVPDTDARSWFSNWGACVDIFAPGSNILSTYISDGGRTYLDGTSMAAPHVAGAVALYWQANPEVFGIDIPAALIQSLGIPDKIGNALTSNNVLLNVANIPTAITAAPTVSSSSSPSISPSTKPSSSPTLSASPTSSPSALPSIFPSTSPSESPISPTLSPTLSPTTSPTASGFPTLLPTVSPSIPPLLSSAPTTLPSRTSPSNSPSVSPTTSPPSSAPTVSSFPGTYSPTNLPSLSPFNPPSVSPTTSSPSGKPTQSVPSTQCQELLSNTMDIADESATMTSSEQALVTKCLDLHVLQNQSHFELFCLSCADQWEPYNILVRIQGTIQDTTWDKVQPLDEEVPASGHRFPYIQTTSAYLVLRPGIEISSQVSWVLSLEVRRLFSSSVSGFDIILGPRDSCDCQIRYEGDNRLGIYFSNTGYGLFEKTNQLPVDVTLDHELSLVHHHPSQTLVLLQNRQVVQTWQNLDFWAEFENIASWFKGEYASSVAIRRITFAQA